MQSLDDLFYHTDLQVLRNAIRLAKADGKRYGHLLRKMRKLTHDKLKSEFLK